MTTISAKVIADSIGEHAPRLTTMELVYPRCIHSEFMTHRMFSRNASSSRAIPVARQIKMVKEDPFEPLWWGRNEPGMQAHDQLEGPDLEEAKIYYRRAFEYAVELAELLSLTGAHKQLVNRILEPYAHIKVVCTATQWSNFFTLRDHEDAEPHIRILAQHMKKAMAESRPQILGPGEWHLPYVTDDDRDQVRAIYPYNYGGTLAKISIARCARVSYLNYDNKRPLMREDLALYQRLVGSIPMHASPTEHVAKPDFHSLTGNWHGPGFHGNFHGWIQYRKTLAGECQ